MSRDRELFAAALELPAIERAAFLDRECAGDPATRARVAALLAGHAAAAQSFLEPNPRLPSPPPAPVTDQPGDRIGRYTLVCKIGEGGCGIVYLAEQTEPVRRQVALKVIKPGMDSREVIARFEAERQALALMDHPGIARVFDAGTTEAGRPFFAMEFVNGQPITTFCDEQRLSMEARLELFARVCHAVQHAHQKGVIHRDLKPSNILVVSHDGVALPKVIDFGIAKATQGRLTDATIATAVAQFIGTPAYMSPEQAELSGLDVDTRTDIYSLGVLLYELLTGRTPFETRELLKVGFDEMRRHIREVEPPRPSTRLNTLGAENLATAAGLRHVPPAKLAGLVAGDLDWIVMRCLEKDRARRYESASGLADDLQRHLRHQPIEARPASAGYRLRKLIRRNRLAFGAGAAVVGALLAGLIASVSQAVRASRAERAAQDEAAVAHAVNDFLIKDLLRQADVRAQADTNADARHDLKVSDALDRAAEKVGTRFAAQPLVEAAVRMAIAESYNGIGLPDKARPHLERAAELRKQHLGLTAIDTLDAVGTLAVVLNALGKFTEAEALGRETLAVRERVYGVDGFEALKSLEIIGTALDGEGKYADAVTLRTRIVAARKKVNGPEHFETLRSMNNLAESLRLNGKLAEAATLHSETLEIQRRVLGPEHPETLTSINNLAVTLDDQGKLAESEKLRLQMMDAQKRVFGPEHPETLNVMNNLAATYDGLGKHAEAIALAKETLEIGRRVYGPEHPKTITFMNNLASDYESAGQTDEAIALFLPLRETILRTLGPEHPFALGTTNNLAKAYTKQKRYAEAIALHEQNLPLLRKVMGPDHPNVFGAMNNLAVNYAAMGKFNEAIALHEPAVAGMKRVLGPEHPTTLVLMTHLSNEYASAGRNDDAIALRTELYALQKKVLGAGNLQTRATQAPLVVSLIAAKRYAEAEPLLRDMLAYREKEIPDDWTTFNTRSGLGEALAGEGKFAEAEPLLVSGAEGMAARLAKIPAGSQHRLAEGLQRLVRFYTDRGQPEKAAAWQQKLDALAPAAAAPKAKP